MRAHCALVAIWVALLQTTGVARSLALPSTETLGSCSNGNWTAFASPAEPVAFSMIYLRRMRKGGSTTIYLGLKSALIGHVALSDVEVQGEEQMTFNTGCLLTPMTPAVVLVTHLREPIGRIISEFHYAGPGGKHR